MRIVAVAFTVLACSAAPAFADSQFCQLQSQVAEKIMEARQSGVSLARMMEINTTMAGAGEEKRLYDEITLRAYEEPLFQTDARKRQSQTEFSNQVMIACVRGSMRSDP